MRRLLTTALLGLALMGCKNSNYVGDDTPRPGDDDDDSQPTPTQAQTPTDPQGATLPPGVPYPFTLNVSGAVTESITFDTSVCTQFMGAPDFTQQWENPDCWVLRLEVRNNYTGPGTYNQTQGAAAKLLRVSGCADTPFYGTDANQGDSATVTVDFENDDIAWGSAVVNGMHGAAGAITVSPTTVPIYCPNVTN